MGEIFWEDFFRRIFLGGFFGRIFLGGILWEELMFLSRFWGSFVSMEGRRKKDFRSLEVRRKLIALKNNTVGLK